MPVVVSQANKMLVVPPSPGALALFPDAPVLPDGNKVIPHGMRETLLLRHLGYDVPNPILMYYDWHGGKPFAVQKATVKMLTENPHAYVLNHMGTGKTKTALWAWDALNQCGLAKKLLVVAPLSTLNFVWARECFSTVPGRKVQVLHGTKQDRLDRLAQDADIYIINHDGLKVIESELHSRADIDTLVLDELAVYRNNSDRSKRMRKFSRRFAIVWGMTGAPMPNEPTDVWAQCQIVTPHTVPKFRTHARDMLMTRISNYIWKPKPDAVDTAFKWMQPSMRYALDDVVELPPLISRTIDVEMSADAKVVYHRVATAMQAMVKDKTITALNAGAAMNKLLQIAGGWVYTKNPEFVRVDPSPRIVALTDLIESAEHKIIVAIPYRHMIEGISKIFRLATEKGRADLDHCIVHGDVINRDEIFSAFQHTERYRIMLCHPGCVHHGLTLTAADMVIWYLPITSLDVYDQFNARFRRIGQAHKQQLMHLQATPVEKKIYRLLRSHQTMQETFLQLVETATEDATP
jgi:SNF2 family DNA or RNA helicase